MKLVIQIPAYNEEDQIESAVRSLPKRLPRIDSIEVVVVDDGSTDRTAEVAAKAGAIVVRLTSHQGLAAAFRRGLDHALSQGADVIVNTDADNQYVAEDIALLIAPILGGAADVVIGDRDTRHSPHMGPIKRTLQRIGSWAVSVASGLRVPDVTSGFRAFSREAAIQINVFNPFTYTLETIIQAGHRNLELRSVKVRTNPPSRPSRLYRGIGTYIRKSVVTIFRIYTLYRPLKTFFLIGSAMVFVGVAIGARFLYYFFATGSAGHIQSLILSAVFLITGFQTMLIGLLADLISVNRKLHEDILIRLKHLQLRSAAPRKERPKRPPASQPAAKSEEPSAEADSQWVWLVDEEEREETPTSSARPRRRKRRRAEASHRVTDPKRHHE